MQLIKVKILKNDIPSSRSYVYKTNEDIKVNDIVKATAWNNVVTGIVVETNVKESDVEFPISSIKEIIGKVEDENE